MIKTIAALVIFLQLVACASTHRTLVKGVQVDPVSAQSAISPLTTAALEITSFRGLFKTVIRHGKDAELIRHAIVFTRPNKIRIETLPRDAAWTLSLLVSEGKNLTLL